MIDTILNSSDKLRIIQEFVPGKQITIAHIIANPEKSLYEKAGITGDKGAIGIVTMTPGETAIIAADIAVKASSVDIGFIDRVNGTLIVTGTVSEVEASLKGIVDYIQEKLGFTVCEITRT